jgi:hypothetical protein
MTPATLTPVARPLELPGAARSTPRTRDGWRPTLDDLLVGVWEGLHRTHQAGCPVCGGVLVAQPQTGRKPAAGQCRDCGSTMS